MKAKTIIFLLIFSILLSNVDASINTTKAYSWLTSKGVNGSYVDIETTSFAISALQYLQPSSYKQTAINFLKSQKNALNCWPLSSCDARSTSIALKTLAENSDIINSSWLTSHQLSELPGNWLLQIITSGSGACTLTYSINNQESIKQINVKNGYFTDCGNTTWLNLDNSCISTNLIKNNPSLQFHISCPTTMAVDRMTITYSYSNTYFPSVYQQTGNTADFKINNGCFGTASTCDYLTTLYANWAFKKLNNYNDINTIFWLKYGNAYQDRTSYNALLYLITNEESYLNKIKAAQQVFPSSSGNYGYWLAESNPSLSDVYVTSLALLALRSTSNTDYIQKAEKWFESQKQSSDGSFNNNVLDTALALYSLNAVASFPGCTENWSCTDWSPKTCTSSLTQTKSCTDTSNCDTTASKPAETRNCQCVEDWQCSSWSTCSNGIQTKTCNDLSNCGTTLSKPSQTQDCATKTCSEQNGKICAESQNCPDKWLTATDTNKCCSVNCTSVNQTCSKIGFECSNEEICPGIIIEASDTTKCCDEKCTISASGGCGDGSCDKDTECSTCSSDCTIKDCCGNNACNSILGEDSNSCPQDCICVINDDCEINYGENSKNCASDCYCGNNQCEPDEDSLSCPSDCKKISPVCDIGEACRKSGCTGEYNADCECIVSDCPESKQEICDDKIDNDDDNFIDCKDSDCSSDSACEKKKSPFAAILTILIIIILAIVGYFFFQKFSGGKGKSTSSKKPPAEFRPFTSRLEKENPETFKTITTPPRLKTKVEEELEKSIEEAKKILKK